MDRQLLDRRRIRIWRRHSQDVRTILGITGRDPDPVRMPAIQKIASLTPILCKILAALTPIPTPAPISFYCDAESFGALGNLRDPHSLMLSLSKELVGSPRCRRSDMASVRLDVF